MVKVGDFVELSGCSCISDIFQVIDITEKYVILHFTPYSEFKSDSGWWNEKNENRKEAFLAFKKEDISNINIIENINEFDYRLKR